MTTRTGPGPLTAAPPTGPSLPRVIAAEWLKLRSLRSTWFCVAATVLTSIAFSMYYGVNIAISNRQGRDDFDAAIGAGPSTGLVLTQWAVVALAIVAVSSEFGTGSIRSTIQWVPQRATVLVAKAVVVGLVALVVGWVAGLAGALAGWPTFGGYGVVDGPALAWDVFAIGVVLAGIGVIAVGIAAAVRSAAGTLGVSVLVLLLTPLLMSASGVAPVERAAEYLPFSAAKHLVDTAPPYPPALAAVLLAAWAVASCAIGAAALRGRDV